MGGYWCQRYTRGLDCRERIKQENKFTIMEDLILSMLLMGAVSSSDGYLPYWMTTNQYGLMPERNGALAMIGASKQFTDSRGIEWKIKGSLAANYFDNTLIDGGSKAHIMLDELYGSMRWKWLSLDLGMKRRENDFLGADAALGSLSVTGGHLVESGNARTMPGYMVTVEPVAIPGTRGHVKIGGAYGDYATTDNRFVDGALVHRMRIGLIGDITDRLSISATLDHYAMWAGDYPDASKPQTKVNLKNYLRVVTGAHGGEDGTLSDRVNTIGDQGGSEIFRADYRGDGWTLSAQHDIPYADKSGMRFCNFPDGVNTIHFGWNDKDRWVSDVVYEHQYTLYQSGPIHVESYDNDGKPTAPQGSSPIGCDNYFNNGYYRSGWTHYGRIIGDPLFLPMGVHGGTWTSAKTNIGIENNRVKSHHLGIGGKLWRKHPYKLMLTYSENFGNYYKPYKGESQYQKEWGTVHEVGLKQLSAAFMGLINEPFSLSRFAIQYGVYLDKGELYEDNFGVTLGVKYEIK